MNGVNYKLVTMNLEVACKYLTTITEKITNKSEHSITISKSCRVIHLIFLIKIYNTN